MPAADDLPAQVARLRQWAAEARRSAARAEARAARFEGQAARLSAPLAGDLMRLAALQRRVQARHLASARLEDQHADRLGTWLNSSRSGEPGRRPAFMDAVVTAIGTHSATVVLFGKQQGEGVIAASDPTGRAAYDLEFILGEGPAHLAVSDRRCVEVAGMDMNRRWPQFGPAVARLGVRAVLAVPVRPPACLGALCVYHRRPAIRAEVTLAADAVADALPLMLSQAVQDRVPGDDVPALPLFDEADFPAVVHQAAGMVSQHCGCGLGDALALLRARAFADGRTAEEIAADVVRAGLRLC